MNNILELKGKRFVQADKPGNGGGPAMNGRIIVTCEHISKLESKLQLITRFWELEKKPFQGALISVYYNKIVAKSNRIAGLLKGANSNFSIVGAKFNDEKTKHIITYYVGIEDLKQSIALLTKTKQIVESLFENGISKTIFDNKEIIDKINFDNFSFTKTAFKQIIADVSYIDEFEVEQSTQQFKDSIITIYDIGMDAKLLFKSIGIDILSSRILDNMTVYLDENQSRLLFEKAPYLVSMATENLLDLSPEDFIKQQQEDTTYIPSPTIEPTIGVIDKHILPLLFEAI